MSFVSDFFAGGAEGVLKGVSDLVKDFKADPLEVAKLQAALDQAKFDLDAKLAAADAQVLQAINASMQAEAKSEHWLIWSWRPLNGYALAIGSLAAVGFVLFAGYQAVVNKDATSLTALPNLVSALVLVLGIPGAVCGVTAWHRGVMQVEQVKGNGK